MGNGGVPGNGPGRPASLGRQEPMSVVRLMGMDKGQISGVPAGLVSRKLAVNPRDNREMLVCLTRTGPITHDAMVEALERNQRLLEEPELT
jgi:hypothetical protein